jgi:muramidase (phage lysozyme)
MKYTRADFQRALSSPYLQAFLEVIRTGEGTLGSDGYRTHFGGSLFSSFAEHPRKVISVKSGGKTLYSSAAGAYQFLSKTWDGLVKQYGFQDFSPQSQDEAAVALIAGRDALEDILAGRFEEATRKCAKEWASLPGSPYGQPTLSAARAQSIYTNALSRLQREPEADMLKPPEQVIAPVLPPSASPPPVAIATPPPDERPVLGQFTFTQLMSLVFLVGGYGLGVGVLWFTDLSGELKAAIASALIVQAVSDVRGFWFGSTAPHGKPGERK